MNYADLPEQYGWPLRLRVENQLGYKMVKWIERIEFVEDHKTIEKGYGGKNEDDEYFDLIANTWEISLKQVIPVHLSLRPEKRCILKM